MQRIANQDGPEFQEETPYEDLPPGTDTDYFDVTVDEEDIPGPPRLHPTSGRRRIGKRPAQFGYMPTPTGGGSAEEETPGPPPKRTRHAPEEVPGAHQGDHLNAPGAHQMCIRVAPGKSIIFN